MNEKPQRNHIDNLRRTIERIEREEKEEKLKFYLKHIGVELSQFPEIYLN